MSFVPSVNHSSKNHHHDELPSHHHVIVIVDGKLLVVDGPSVTLKTVDFYRRQGFELSDMHWLGEWSEEPVYIASTNVDVVSNVTSDFELTSLRACLGEVDAPLFELLSYACQVQRWDRHHRYCGQCGRPTQLKDLERARHCSSCELDFYPKISPCVIGLVYRGDHILLARHAKHPNGRYTLLAGYIEPGESAEQAFAREVKEEVNIDIHSPEYVTSQAWPFPGQLMLGYFSEYQSGDIRVDGVEITDAKWFPIDDLPQLPSRHTISRELIEQFLRLRISS